MSIVKDKTERLFERLRDAKRLVRINDPILWQHYKGGVYMVVDVAIDTRDGDVNVIYRRVDGPDYNRYFEEGDGGIKYARPLSEWFDWMLNGTIQRFTPVKKRTQTVYVKA